MIPFDKNCTTPKAEELIKLYAEYVEGNIESSKNKYNALIKTASLKDLVYIIYRTPFERHAVNLGKVITDLNKLPFEVKEKLQNDMAFVYKMDKLPQI